MTKIFEKAGTFYFLMVMCVIGTLSCIGLTIDLVTSHEPFAATICIIMGILCLIASGFFAGYAEALKNDIFDI
jgi:hypothetical protein